MIGHFGIMRISTNTDILYSERTVHGKDPNALKHSNKSFRKKSQTSIITIWDGINPFQRV